MRLRRLLLVPSLLCVSACSSGPSLRALPIRGYASGDIWRAIVAFANTRGYREDASATDVGRRIFQSHWKGVTGVPIQGRGMGLRNRLYARISRGRADEAPWLVEYYIEVQKVADRHRSLDPRDDDWRFAFQDAHKEEEFVYVMRLALPGQPTTEPGSSATVEPGRTAGR
ncbi:MAG: hypothetical protein KDC87_18520 [Planctomycetes bacterium]|nr:hypothetical protein [Planctomycetota bacterium]